MAVGIAGLTPEEEEALVKAIASLKQRAEEQKSKPTAFKKGVAESEIQMLGNALGKDYKLEETPAVPVSATNGETIYMNPHNGIAETEEDFHALLNHEKAHILFKSNSVIPHMLKEKNSGISLKAIHTVYNILEDMRIEENWSKIFPGSKEGFERLRKKAITSTPTNPIEVLGAIRAGREDLIKKSSPELQTMHKEFKEKTDELYGKDYMATYIIEGEILPTMKKWYEERTTDEEPQPGTGRQVQESILEKKRKKQKEAEKNASKENKGQEKGKQGQGQEKNQKGQQEGQGKGEPQEKEKSQEKGNEKGKQEQGQGNGEPQNQEQQGSSQSSGQQGNEEKAEAMSNADADRYNEQNPLNEGETKTETNMKEKGKGRSDINSRITMAQFAEDKKENPNANPTKSQRQKIMDWSERYNANEESSIKNAESIAKAYDPKAKAVVKDIFAPNETTITYGKSTKPISRIKNLLTSITQKEQEEEKEYGKRLNINKAIQKVINPNSTVRPFTHEKANEGTDFWILLDLSMSMKSKASGASETKIKLSQQALATIYDNIKSSRAPIRVRMFGFSTATDNTDGSAPPLIFEFNRKRLETLQPLNLTPTGPAIDYVRQKFKKEGATYKNLIILTDGYPETSSNRGNDVKLATEAMHRIKREGVNVFTMFLQAQNQSEAKEIFGSKNFYNIKDSEKIEPTLTKILKKDILERLRV